MTQREQFEAWARSEFMNVSCWEDGTYRAIATHAALAAWQASAEVGRDAAFNDALEFAAKACDARVGRGSTLARQFEAQDCAAAIRALKREPK
jgi:hypothetical protein